MAENTYKIDPVKRRRNLFRWIEDQLKIESLVEEGLPLKYVPHVLFCTFLGILYVGNTHYAETTQRKVNQLEVEVEDMRADYITLKSDYMHAQLQSEVARKVRALGLIESEDPPHKIVVPE